MTTEPNHLVAFTLEASFYSVDDRLKHKERKGQENFTQTPKKGSVKSTLTVSAEREKRSSKQTDQQAKSTTSSRFP
jgi:hypothetical protein